MSKPKLTHREVKFSKEEMEYDLPAEIDFSKLQFVGRGREGLEMARKISQTKGAAKQKLIDALPPREPDATRKLVPVDADVYAMYKNAEEINETLRVAAQLRQIGSPKKKKSA